MRCFRHQRHRWHLDGDLFVIAQKNNNIVAKIHLAFLDMQQKTICYIKGDLEIFYSRGSRQHAPTPDKLESMRVMASNFE
jgi:hypothetical protein